MINFSLLSHADDLNWDLETCVGFIPMFFNEADPRPAKEQIRENYIGGWHKFSGFDLRPDGSIKYSGDPAYHPIAEGKLRDEVITVFPYAWVMITQPDGSYEIARLD